MLPKRVGITGGIGSGKTTVCKVFETLGIPVFYSDVASKKILNENRELHGFLVEAFGEEVLNEEGVNKEVLASHVFGDKKKLNLLNSKIHPLVRDAFDAWTAQQNAPYVLNEAAILFETGAYKKLDQSILVTAPIDLKIARVSNRDRVTKEQVVARMNNQWKDAEKEPLADFIIVNDEQDSVITQVLAIHQKLADL